MSNEARISVESWDPDYGSPLSQLGADPSDATVDTEVELAAGKWRPIAPRPDLKPAHEVLFIDGVRRIDAMVWTQQPGEPARRGICASYAAGILRASKLAKVEVIEVRRGHFCRAPGVSIPTSAGTFEVMTSTEDELDKLSLALQQRLGELEIAVAASIKRTADLIVVDGPLSGRQNVPGAVGYVKTHRVSYLPPELEAVVGTLVPGERSPIFTTSTNWTRYSWYLRLPGPTSHPWSGITRLEASADLPAKQAIELADLTAATLPGYASVPHKDPRAPQNLFPIGGLERELRHRLGDAALVLRALRTAAASA